MNKKNLIVSGCSFTIGHNLREKGSWAFYLSDMLGLELHNQARGGMGNEFIANSIIGYLTQNPELIEDSIVIVAWSEITRMLGTFHSIENNKSDVVTIRPQDFIMDNSKKHWTQDVTGYHEYTLENMDIVSPYFSCWNFAVYKTYVAMLNLKTFLELHKIPYLFFDAVGDNRISINSNNMIELNRPLNKEFPKLCLNEKIDIFLKPFLNNKIIDKIFNDVNYISFYGLSMNNYMHKDIIKSEKYTEGNDGHPNEYASNYFAKLILNEYERLYNK